MKVLFSNLLNLNKILLKQMSNRLMNQKINHPKLKINRQKLNLNRLTLKINYRKFKINHLNFKKKQVKRKTDLETLQPLIHDPTLQDAALGALGNRPWRTSRCLSQKRKT